jgi:hypothetical protein
MLSNNFVFAGSWLDMEIYDEIRHPLTSTGRPVPESVARPSSAATE